MHPVEDGGDAAGKPAIGMQAAKVIEGGRR